MKLNAILGKGTGKLGGMVLSVNSGEQIVREYNPKVSNPQTDAQVEQRAKFKLLSQLAAALSTSIAFRKMKMQSPRNRFVSANLKNASFENNEASVALDSLDLTGGSQLIPTLSVTRGTGEAITIALSEAAAGDIKRIVYNIYKVTDGNKLQFIKEVLVSEAGAGRTFSTETTAPEADIVVYAYGIKDTTTRTTTKFEEYEASADNNNAVLDVLRALNSTDYVLTATAGEVLPFSGGMAILYYNDNGPSAQNYPFPANGQIPMSTLSGESIVLLGTNMLGEWKIDNNGSVTTCDRVSETQVPFLSIHNLGAGAIIYYNNNVVATIV